MAKDRKNSGANFDKTDDKTPAQRHEEATSELVEGGGKKYETMVVGVSKANKEAKDKLDALAQKLGCKASALVWAGVGMLLANPPTTAPAGAQPATGSAPGFWVVHDQNPKTQRVEKVRVVQVSNRTQVTNGRTFFRFKDGDAKALERAKNQALKAAAYDAALVGYKPQGGTFNVEQAS